jgi:hypothetical protein
MAEAVEIPRTAASSAWVNHWPSFPSSARTSMALSALLCADSDEPQRAVTSTNCLLTDRRMVLRTDRALSLAGSVASDAWNLAAPAIEEMR